MPHSHRHHHAKRGLMDKIGEFGDRIRDAVGGDDIGNTRRHDDDDDDDGGDDIFPPFPPPKSIKTVYTTLAQTFSGPVAGFSTLGQGPDPKPTPTSTTSKKTDPKPTPKPSPSSSSDIPKPSSISSSSSIVQPTTQPVFSESLGNPGPSTTLTGPSTTPIADANTVKNGDGDSGSSAGAKAGIAFGVLGSLALVGLLVFLFYRRRKRTTERLEADNEKKMHGHADPYDAMTVRSNAHAPRISLRPVTQFFPNWNLDKRASKGAAMALNSTAPSTAPGGANGQSSNWERITTNQGSNPANPFGSQAERVHEPIVEEPSPSSSPPSDPFTANGPAIAAGAAAGAAAGVTTLTRKTSMRNRDPHKSLDLTLSPPAAGPAPPSPAGTEFSVSSIAPGSAMPPSNGAAAIAAAGGPANSNVHRVQLDFKPSLDDEMELKAGDLIRLLHEYDDGWALVIRLDRSQQGVVPRTCLSTRPVKPRLPPGGPRPGPPVNPNGHPRGPNQLGQRPMGPPGRQGMPPQGRPRMGPGGPGPRPMSPAGRPQSPGPRINGPPANRPQSPSGMNRPTGPPGPSLMNPAHPPPQGSPPSIPTKPIGRKPVPGQSAA